MSYVASGIRKNSVKRKSKEVGGQILSFLSLFTKNKLYVDNVLIVYNVGKAVSFFIKLHFA